MLAIYKNNLQFVYKVATEAVLGWDFILILTHLFNI